MGRGRNTEAACGSLSFTLPAEPVRPRKLPYKFYSSLYVHSLNLQSRPEETLGRGGSSFPQTLRGR